MIAGIGADDCLSCRQVPAGQCRCPPGSSATTVMNRAYYDSAWAMLLTSVTTAAAFFSNAIMPHRPLMGVCHFYGLDGHVRLHLRHHDLRGSLAYQHKFLLRYRRDQHELVQLLDFGFLGLHRSVSRETTRVNTRTVSSAPEIMDSKRDHRSRAERILADNVFPVIHKTRWFLVIVLFGVFAGGLVGGSSSPPKDSNSRFSSRDLRDFRISNVQGSEVHGVSRVD